MATNYIIDPGYSTICKSRLLPDYERLKSSSIYTQAIVWITHTKYFISWNKWKYDYNIEGWNGYMCIFAQMPTTTNLKVCMF